MKASEIINAFCDNTLVEKPASKIFPNVYIGRLFLDVGIFPITFTHKRIAAIRLCFIFVEIQVFRVWERKSKSNW
jgi:hypothetical protein